MPNEIAVDALRQGLSEALDIACLDVRETAEYNLAHIGGSVSLPRRQLEYRVGELVPYKGTRIIVCDDDGRRASLAAQTLASMGYTDVSVLAGGMNRWVTEGLSTEWGVNVPSKDFGEKVLLTQGVPEIEPDELNQWLAGGRKVVLLDSRTPEEHQRACIPGSRSMPGAELGLRAWELIDDPTAPVVVHCAGRTRSIIGAGTLRRMGFENVYCLKNGTMGWELAGLQVETGSDRLELPAPSPEKARAAEAIARRIALEEGVRFIDPTGVDAIAPRSKSENVYLLDVRSRDEYEAGHIPGFRWVPGGQAVQAWDSYLAVKGGQIIFCCDGVTRAGMTASWFAQMGFPNVHVLDGGTSAWTSAGRRFASGSESSLPAGFEEARKALARIQPGELQERLAAVDPPVVIFVGTSDEFSAGHVPGSSWVSRSWLELRIEGIATKDRPVIVTCSDGVASVLASATLKRLGYNDVSVLEGGLRGWRGADLPVERGLTGVTEAPNDVLPARRSYAEMMNYLRWEEELGRKYANPHP
jgi:rhodanese-related sulfurtransferase